MKENSNRDLQKKLTQETCEREKGVKKNRPLKETYKRDLYMWKGGGKKRRIKETYKRGVWTWKGGKENRLLKETYNRDVYMWNKTSTHCNTLQHISRASQKSPGDPKKTMSCESDACVCVSGGARGGGGLMGFFGRPRMRVAVCCSVLQCVAVWCSELQWVEALDSVCSGIQSLNSVSVQASRDSQDSVWCVKWDEYTRYTYIYIYIVLQHKGHCLVSLMREMRSIHEICTYRSGFILTGLFSEMRPIHEICMYTSGFILTGLFFQCPKKIYCLLDQMCARRFAKKDIVLWDFVGPPHRLINWKETCKPKRDL